MFEKYPHIEAALGVEWLIKWQGRLTDAELQREEEHCAAGAPAPWPGARWNGYNWVGGTP